MSLFKLTTCQRRNIQTRLRSYEVIGIDGLVPECARWPEVTVDVGCDKCA